MAQPRKAPQPKGAASKKSTPVKQRPKTRNSSKAIEAETPDKSPNAEEQSFNVIPLPEAFGRVLEAVVIGRIQHRALVQYVIENDPAKWATYSKLFAEIAERDYQPLFAELVLSKKDFKKVFSDWKKDDTKRYKVVAEKRRKG